MKLTKELIEEKIEKLIIVKGIYDKTHTLQKTAKILKISRERVRQLLRKGEKYGLYRYEIHRSRREKGLFGVFNKESLVKEIKLHDTDEIISKLDITKREFKKLLIFFDINRKEYNEISRRGKCLRQYDNVFVTLGHHPSTTELSSNSEWKSLLQRIGRSWGSISVFRREYGIEKRKHSISAKLQRKWRKAMERNEKVKKEILKSLKRSRALSKKELSIILNINQKKLYNKFLSRMVEEGILVIIGKGPNTRYKVNNENGQSRLTLPRLLNQS